MIKPKTQRNILIIVLPREVRKVVVVVVVYLFNDLWIRRNACLCCLHKKWQIKWNVQYRLWLSGDSISVTVFQRWRRDTPIMSVLDVILLWKLLERNEWIVYYMDGARIVANVEKLAWEIWHQFNFFAGETEF